MSRPKLAADIAALVDGEIVPGIARAITALDAMKFDFQDDSAETGAMLDALAELLELSRRLESAEVRALLARAKAGRE